MTSKTVLITGATGKQGGGVISALLDSPDANKYKILALTRNSSSPAAIALAAKSPLITIVQGDSTKPVPIFEAHKPIDSVFCMTAAAPATKVPEEDQAYPLIDESVKQGVKHFVFTSVDRGGPGVSEGNPTVIPHFASKHRIEEYLKKKSEGTDMAWTILRPVAFMDNLSPGFFGKVFPAMWAGLGTKPLQLVSVHDIGVFGARALRDREAYKGRAISLAGDELTVEQGRTIFAETMGRSMPETYGFVGWAVKSGVKEMGTMFKWFETDGYGADIKALRKEEPKLQDFKTWLKESSGFSK